MNLSKVDIAIKTFLRDSALFNTIAAIKRTLPECRMLIADCGDQTEEKDLIYADLRRDGHKVFILDYDAGFGRMSNCLAAAAERPYFLIASDDFDFNPPDVRKGIERMVRILDAGMTPDIISGRVDNRFYEFNLEDHGDVIKEVLPVPLWITVKSDGFKDRFHYCDLTVNYSLIRKEVFQKVFWDNDQKICQGEHGAWFLDCRRAGIEVGYADGVNINQQENQNSERYNQYRQRTIGRSCFDKRGIRKYILASGQVDYQRE